MSNNFKYSNKNADTQILQKNLDTCIISKNVIPTSASLGLEHLF